MIARLYSYGATPQDAVLAALAGDPDCAGTYRLALNAEDWATAVLALTSEDDESSCAAAGARRALIVEARRGQQAELDGAQLCALLGSLHRLGETGGSFVQNAGSLRTDVLATLGIMEV